MLTKFSALQSWSLEVSNPNEIRKFAGFSGEWKINYKKSLRRTHRTRLSFETTCNACTKLMTSSPASGNSLVPFNWCLRSGEGPETRSLRLTARNPWLNTIKPNFEHSRFQVHLGVAFHTFTAWISCNIGFGCTSTKQTQANLCTASGNFSTNHEIEDWQR